MSIRTRGKIASAGTAGMVFAFAGFALLFILSSVALGLGARA